MKNTKKQTQLKHKQITTTLLVGVVVLSGLINIAQSQMGENSWDCKLERLIAEPPTVRTWDNLPAPSQRTGVPDTEISLRVKDPEKLKELKQQPFTPPAEEPYTVTTTTLSDTSESLAGDPPKEVLRFDGVDNGDNVFLYGSWARPPDPVIAAGPYHIVTVVNRMFAVYDKYENLLMNASLGNWFSDVYTDVNLPFDPRIAYDHYEDHWLIVALARNTTSEESWFLLSVSQTNDPTDSWWNFRFDATVGSTWADYPDIGFDGVLSTDGGAIYLTANQFTWGGASSGAQIVILDKDDLYSGNTAMSYARYINIPAFTIRAAHTFTDSTIYEYFIFNDALGATNDIYILDLDPTNLPGTLPAPDVINIGNYNPPPPAEQDGTTDTLDTIDCRIYNCVYKGGYLYAAFTQNYDDVAALHILKIDISSSSTDINEVYTEPGAHLWFPAIYPDSDNNIMLVFARSDNTSFASICYTGRKPSDSETRSFSYLKLGETSVESPDPEEPARWGDYFGIACDPVIGRNIWIYGEYAKDIPQYNDPEWEWGTYVGVINFDNTPPSTILTVGNPKYGVDDEYVTTKTLIELEATDSESYVTWINYYIDTTYYPFLFYPAPTNILGVMFGEECTHDFEYWAVDGAYNEESHHTKTFYVDSSPPSTVLIFGTPYFFDPYTHREWINKTTSIYLLAVDHPSGCAVGFWRIWYSYDPLNETWDYSEGEIAEFTIPFNGKFEIRYYSIDFLFNTEKINTRKVHVDGIPPKSTLKWNKTATELLIWINAVDKGVGVKEIYYDLFDVNKPWLGWQGWKSKPHNITLRFDRNSRFRIRYYALDHLGNIEPVNTTGVNAKARSSQSNYMGYISRQIQYQLLKTPSINQEEP